MTSKELKRLEQEQIMRLAQDLSDLQKSSAKKKEGDILKIDIPLFIRLLEFAREDAADDIDLHEVADKAIELGDKVLGIDDYDSIIPELPEKEDKPKKKEPKEKSEEEVKEEK